MTPQPEYYWRLWYRQTNAYPWTFAGRFRLHKEMQLSQVALEKRGYICKPEYLGKPVGLPVAKSVRKSGSVW
jgi:hypothetical protein